MTKIRRYADHPFWQALGILVLAFLVIEFLIPALPGSSIVPKSVALQYMLTVLAGVLIYVSDSEDRWARFKEPINSLLVEPRLRIMRGAVLGVLTLLIGWITLAQARTTVSAPPNLRSIHPAPPTEITFRGKSLNMAGLKNPLREHAESLAEHTEEGKRIYYQNCLACHGDHLDGVGHYAHGFNPLPANFQDNGTIAQLSESFVFWRVAKGGPGLPREATPWNSAMPKWEDFLTEREIWQVIIFIYEQTGWKPRVMEEAHEGGEKSGGH